MFTITDNISQFLRSLAEHEKAAGFARTVALTRTARATSVFLGAEIKRVFDRPVPFTQNAVTWLWATAAKDTLNVFIRFFAGKGVPASKFLRAQVLGGERRQKRSEVALSRAGLMGNRGYWVPGPGIKLDAYGNVSGGTIRRILSDLQVAGDQSRTKASANRNKRYANVSYFAPQPGSKLHPGVWARDASGRIAPALLFVTHTHYSQRFDFFDKGTGFAERQFPIEMAQAIREGWHLPRSTQRALGLDGKV